MNIIWITSSRTCQNIWHGWSSQEGKNKLFVHQVMAHNVTSWEATFQFLLIVTFLWELCLLWKRDRPSFLLFFPSFLLSLHTSPPSMPLSPAFKAMKNHWTGKWWEPSGSFTRRLWSHPGHLTSLYQNVWKVAWHFLRKIYSYIISVWISCQKTPTELCNGHRVWASPTTNWNPSGARFQPEILGHRKKKKLQDIGKNPHKATSVFGDWLNEQFCYLQICFPLQIYFMLLIFQGLRSISE